MLDTECRGVKSHITAHEPRQLNVADLFIAGVFPVNPVFLDGGGFETELCGDGGYGAGVVGLDAADGDEGITALGLGLSGEVSVFRLDVL